MFLILGLVILSSHDFRALFIADSHIPLNVVERKSFLHFISLLQPAFQVPNRHQLRTRILQEAQSVFDLVCLNFVTILFYSSFKIKIYTKAAQNPSYCMDLWKSKARVSIFAVLLFIHFFQDYFMGITLQFVSDDWKLMNLPVAFTLVTGSHTAEALGGLVADTLSNFLGLYPISPPFLTFQVLTQGSLVV